MDWQLIEAAPKDGTFVDLCTYNGHRYTDCFYCTEKKLWVQQVRYLQKNMKRKTIFQQVINPTHYMLPPALPESIINKAKGE